MRYFYTGIISLFMALTSFTLAAYAESPIYTKSSKLALQGYDTVSYFQGNNGPVKGSANYSASYKGATWHFSSKENLGLFKAAPERYAPQYGGYCAWAAAHGALAKAEPDVYHIEDGKLYLNYDRSIAQKWTPRRLELIPVADQKFPELIAQ